MLTRFRRHLGMLKDRLERKAATLGSAGSAAKSYAPISKLDKGLMLDWITGKIDDDALVEHARARDDKLELMARACAVRSGNPRVWCVRAEFCLAAGRTAEALEHARHACVLAPTDARVGLVLLKALVAAQLPDEALRLVPGVLDNARRANMHSMRIEACGHWRSLEPASIEPLLESARARVAMGELDAAIAEFDALITGFGPRADVLLPLGAIYQDLGRNEDAQRAYARAAELEPGNVDALSMAGQCAYALGELALADRWLSRALEVDPRSAFAQFILGQLRSDQGRVEDAVRLIRGVRAANRGEPWTETGSAALLQGPVRREVADREWAVSRAKLAHDFEQLRYLRAKGRLGALFDPVIAQYRAAHADPRLRAEANTIVALDPEKYPLLARTYKAPLHAPDPEPPAGPLLNPALDWREIEDRYLQASPHLVSIDDFLSLAALEATRAFCLESTIWNEIKGTYLGAFMPDGFAGRLLSGIAAELRAKAPRVLAEHLLQTMWGYKYEARSAGIGVHADGAAINVNFWITPDDANLDPESGGMRVYTHKVPKDWDFARFNYDHAEIRRTLESAGAGHVSVPYRANRVVIFDSGLFHETDALRFREGYENRRVNITMLYGARAA